MNLSETFEVPYVKHATAVLFALVLIHAEVASAEQRVSPEINALMRQAEAGDTNAQFRVATAYDSGQGAPRDGKEAMRWYLKAAENGHAEAQNSVGSGLQAAKRFKEALPWYERASAQRHALATNNLAYLYDLGLGVSQDRRRAFELYSRAADLGWAESMWNIANMYGAGQLGSVDMFLACVWTMRARRYAQPNDQHLQAQFTRIIPYMQRKLSERDMAKCGEDADAWKPATLYGQ